MPARVTSAIVLVLVALALRQVSGQQGMLTTYTDCGPTCGCGVPKGKLSGLPVAALNLIQGSRTAGESYPISGGIKGAYDNGDNCGRWVRIELGRVCKGAGNTQWTACDKGSVSGYAALESDDRSGDVIYGYIADYCPDQNYWCRENAGHIDIVRRYTNSEGLSAADINAREISWSFLSGTPSGFGSQSIKFMWKSGTKWLDNFKGFYAALIIYDTDNGIGKVEQQQGGSWVSLSTNGFQGSQYVLKEPSNYRDAGAKKEVTVRITDKSGSSYGTYTLSLEKCGNTCGSDTDI